MYLSFTSEAVTVVVQDLLELNRAMKDVAWLSLSREGSQVLVVYF